VCQRFNTPARLQGFRQEHKSAVSCGLWYNFRGGFRFILRTTLLKKTFLLLFLLLTVSTVQASTYTEEWQDTKRHRTVPVRVYLPEMAAGAKRVPPYPVVLLSHGLGGSREGFPYLGEHWSKHGYIVLTMQHPGSDHSVWQGRAGQTVIQAMQGAVNAQTAADRVNDVKFVLDELEARNKKEGDRLFGLLDLQRIALGGHSFGAHTAIASVGRFPYEAEPRLKAAIAMSSDGPERMDPKEAFRRVKTPILHLTGTKDVSLIRPATQAVDRRIAFDNISGVDQYLVIFTDGDHMLFSGHTRLRGLSPLEQKYQPMIQSITLHFLDAYLKEDAEAQQRLHETEKTLGDGGTFEKKMVSPK